MPPTDASSPSPLFQLHQGIEQFNQGQYYACHDTLEAIWMEAMPTDKPFYQGILQFAVALHHLGNHNWQGAAILLGESMNRLQPFEPDYQGVDVTALVDCGLAWLQALQITGKDQVAMMAAAMASDHDQALTLNSQGQSLPPLQIRVTGD